MVSCLLGGLHGCGLSITCQSHNACESCRYLYNVCLFTAQITVGYDPDSYVTSESAGQLNLTIRVFSHPMTGAPRPFSLVVNTEDGTASVLL